MSLAWYIVLERNIPGFDHFVDGKALAHASEALDRIAREAGVEPLIKFFSVSLSDLPQDVQLGTEGPDTTSEIWFSADEGVKTISALILGAHAAGLGERIINDLRTFQAVLSAASRNGTRWHLAIDY